MNRQRIALWVAAGTCLLTAAAHSAGQLAGPRPPDTADEATLLRLMTEHRMRIMGVERTLDDFMTGFGWTYTLLLVTLAALTLLVLRRRPDDAPLLGMVAGLCTAVSLLLLAISIRYFVVPPMAFGAVIVLAFAVAALPAKAASS